MRRVVIWGCGGHGREINWLCEQMGIEVLGFLDERPEMKGRHVNGVPVLGDLSDIRLYRNEIDVVCAGVGDPALKRRFVSKTYAAGFRPAPAIVHPSVSISPRNRIGLGTVVCEGAILTDNIVVGEFVVINRGANISHDNVIGDYATIAPGVNLAGNITVGEGAYIGIGASVREKITVGEWSVIGGGAFVSADVRPRTLAAGVPARWIKTLDDAGYPYSV